MYLKFIIPILILFLGMGLSVPQDSQEIASKEVAEVLIMLGDEPLPHYPDTTVEGVSAAVGEDIIKRGRSKDGKERVPLASRYFTCTACHNTEKEDPDPAHPTAQARLDFVTTKGIPYLQGSPLYGIVNRTSYYNGDYEEKYGDLVFDARHDLRKSIQLCATDCSQGRPLEKWEMESVLAYLWTIGLKMEDLVLSNEEKETIDAALNDEVETEKAVELIKSKYVDRYPATFVEPLEPLKRANTYLVGDPANGKLLYENSCQHCHYNNQYSFFLLDNTELTFEQLRRNMDNYSDYSLYQIVRHGTYPLSGKKAYMPQYTAEKMTEQQLADLREYIMQQAN